MKKLFYILALVVMAAFWAGAPFVAGCGTSPQRATHTTLEGVGRAVDLAEREYLDGVLARRYRTNGFPETQAAYGLFQIVYSNAVWQASRDTNRVGLPEYVRAAADQALTQINSAKGAK